MGERVNKTFREIRSQSKVQVLDSKQNLSFKLVIQVSKSWLEIVLEFSVFTKGPFKYYVSMFLVFLGPPKNTRGTSILRPPTYVSIKSTVNQQKLSFSDPTHPPLCWRNT